jgi:hypothetical protein
MLVVAFLVNSGLACGVAGAITLFGDGPVRDWVAGPPDVAARLAGLLLWAVGALFVWVALPMVTAPVEKAE